MSDEKREQRVQLLGRLEAETDTDMHREILGPDLDAPRPEEVLARDRERCRRLGVSDIFKRSHHALVVALVSACSGDVASPGNRVIPRVSTRSRTKDASPARSTRRRACCSYFQDGVTVTVEITNSTADALTFAVVSQGGGLWNPPSWTLEWSTVTTLGDAFLGRADYASQGLFTQTLRRSESGLECSFAIVWPESGIGDGTCRVGTS